MNERSILKVKIESILDELAWLECAPERLKFGFRFYQNARNSLLNEIKSQQNSLVDLLKRVESNLSLEDCWGSFRSRREECVPVISEYIGYLEGALARDAGADGGVCDIADAMLYDLSRRTIPWERFTILAEQESFSDMAQIIRLRFPEVSIWNLPIAGHEFGHFVGQRMEKIGNLGNYREPFKEILNREGHDVDEIAMRYLHEHFADIFATYTLGPAFTCTCVLLRFNPETAFEDGKSHPAEAKRVHVMLDTLEKLNDVGSTVAGPYQGLIDDLRDLWRRCVETAGHPEDLDKDTVATLDLRFEDLYVLISSQFPASVYAGWSRAIEISNQLTSDTEVGEVLKNGDAIADVLNAAWQSRIRNWDAERFVSSRIADRALDFCREIISRSA